MVITLHSFVVVYFFLMRYRIRNNLVFVPRKTEGHRLGGGFMRTISGDRCPNSKN